MKFYTETNLIISLKNCQNVVQIVDSLNDTTTGQTIFSMELGDGSLDDFIKRSPEQRIKPTLLLQIMADCLEALIFATNRGICHLDLKPANIIYFKTENRKLIKGLQTNHIVDPSLVFKISDWGRGMLKNNKTKIHSSSLGLTMGYAANEILNNSAFNENKADVFSLGMSLLACCGIPYAEFKHLSSIQKSKSFDRDFDELFDSMDHSILKLKNS